MSRCCDREGSECEPDPQGPGARAEDQNLWKAVSLHEVVQYPHLSLGILISLCIGIKALVKQVSQCMGVGLGAPLTHHICRAKLFLWIRRGQEKNTVLREPRSGPGFWAASQTWTVKLTLHGASLQRLTQPLQRQFPIPLKAPFQGKAAHVRNMCVPASA